MHTFLNLLLMESRFSFSRGMSAFLTFSTTLGSLSFVMACNIKQLFIWITTDYVVLK